MIKKPASSPTARQQLAAEKPPTPPVATKPELGNESKVEAHDSRTLEPPPRATQPENSLNQWLQRRLPPQRRVIAVDDTSDSRQDLRNKQSLTPEIAQHTNKSVPKDRTVASVASDVSAIPRQIFVGSDETKQTANEDGAVSNFNLRDDTESARRDATESSRPTRQRQFSPANRMSRALTREAARVSPSRHDLQTEDAFAPWKLLHTWGSFLCFCSAFKCGFICLSVFSFTITNTRRALWMRVER